MTNQHIQFKKRRELGEILSDTFSFVRANYKPLFAVLLRTSLIPFILLVLASAYYQYALIDLAEQFYLPAIASFVGMTLAGLFFYASASAAIYSFIKFYDESQSLAIDVDTVVQRAKAKIGSLVGLYVLSYIMLIFGFLFFLIPGIYFLVPLAIVVPVLMFKELTVIDAIKESFKLIKGFWWVTLGTVIVVVIVIGVMSFAFSVPVLIYNLAKMAISSAEMNSFNSPASGDFIFLSLNALASAGSNLLSIILLIALSFIYFDLDEEKNKTGLKQKIDELDR